MARVERQVLDARSQEDLPPLPPKGVYPPKLWQHLKKIEGRFEKQQDRKRQRAERGVAHQAAQAVHIMQREEKFAEKKLKHIMNQHPALQRKMEGRLGEELAREEIKVEMDIQRIAKKTEEKMARNKLRVERNEERKEKRAVRNINHNQAKVPPSPQQNALLGGAVRGALANVDARKSELAQLAHNERQALSAMSKQAVSVLPPQLRAATSDPLLLHKFDKVKGGMENKVATVEKVIKQTVKKTESNMERHEKQFEKQIGHVRDQIMNPNRPQVLPTNQLQPRVQKMETHLEQKLAQDEQRAQRAIQKELVQGRQVIEKGRVQMQKDVLKIEKNARGNMNHHHPFKAPVTAKQCFLPGVMHDMRVACCLHHRAHCPQVSLSLLKRHCLTPQASWSAMQHLFCCQHFSVGCGTPSSLQHSVATQQFQSQHSAVGVGAGQLPQRGLSTTAMVTTTTTTTSMAGGNSAFVNDRASASVVDSSATLPSTAPPLAVALAATAMMMVALALAACWCLRAKGKVFEPEDHDEEVGREALLSGELKQMLSDAEQADPELCVGRSSEGKGAQPVEPDPAQRAEAEQEIERVLSAKDASSIFGHGDAQQQHKAFRRLVRLLHPDKHLVSGPRANMALRLVLESHRSPTANK